MRLPTCIAAYFAWLCVAVAPLTAQAQSQPRQLTPEERVFVQAFDEMMEDTPNNLVRLVPEWQKANHGQLLCTRLNQGYSIASVHESLMQRSLKISDPTIRQEFRDYSNRMIVMATYKLCPEYHDAVQNYINFDN
jgi:hypothetical protein